MTALMNDSNSLRIKMFKQMKLTNLTLLRCIELSTTQAQSSYFFKPTGNIYKKSNHVFVHK